jgi:hypothetical protein
MATITITIPDNEIARAISAICKKYNYQDTILGTPEQGMIPNPESKAQFAKRMVAQIIKDAVLQQELTEAKQAVSVSDINVT